MRGPKGKSAHQGGRDTARDRRPPVQRGNEPARPRLTSDREKPHIWGFHAAAAALTNSTRPILRVLATATGAPRLQPLASARRLEVELVEPRDLDRLLGADTVHQGILVIAEPLAESTLDELVEAARAGGPIVVLDQVTDPHNVGAILRSAAVFGASGVVMTRRHSPPLDGALAKAASGALEHVPVVLVANLARALDDLEGAGVQRIGLAGEADMELAEVLVAHPAAVVLGSEGDGLRRLTREHCSALVRIGARGALASLNVSNATAVALYALTAQRRTA